MSRCFPFPPPGYERKHQSKNLDVLREEKRKEKKHKEKKDKENREGKEKREKDRSEGKHRDKRNRKEKRKDKKDKHRNKKKDEEDQSKDKEKSSISEESTVAGKIEGKGEERLRPTVHNKATGSSLDEVKHATQFQVQNGGKPIQNNLVSLDLKESKFALEPNTTIRNHEKESVSQLLERVSGVCKRDQDAARAAVRDSSGLLADDKGQNKDNGVHRKTSVPIWNLSGMAKYKIGGMPRLVEEQGDQRFEGKEKSKEKGDDPSLVEQHGDQRLEGKEKSKEKGDIKRGESRKDKEREKHSHRKDKNEGKEKEKKRVKVKEKIEDKETKEDVSKDQRMNDLIGVSSYKSMHMVKDFNSNAVNEGNMRKRKDLGSNCFIHESEVRPNKLLKEASHQLTENGRKMDAARTPNLSTSDKQQGIPENVRLGKKDQRVNGITEAQQLSVSKPKTSTATIITNQIAEASKKPPDPEKCMSKALTVPKLEDQIAEASRKPPHPDSKYLSVVLTVPKMEWSEFDDQDWLFSRKDPPSEKPEVGSDQMNQEHCVWSEAMHVESTDVYAMPYVIPY
ncbi:unnamed protein product [Fraxinus pennsylvanica]|uniref:Myb-like protein X n=1 Tax=Fraxinus pennsylvanica TaxID=56036 RepID=A0AAD2A5C0_9LAMI|nr:unnamed protein product [Fraxinus pennsylvanica]